MDSILTSIKKLLGITEEYEHFDTDLIIYINSVFSILAQLGIGPKDGFSIRDKTSKWSDFLNDKDDKRLEMIKSYVYMKVKLMFDPPTNSSLLESMTRFTNEFEWRANVVVD